MAERGIGRASALVASGTLVSRLLGFVKVWMLAHVIGSFGSAPADAYTIATQIPTSIYAIIGGGLLTAVVVPQIVRASAQHDDGGAAYINKLVTIALLLLGVVAIGATIASPVLMPLFNRAHGPKLELAVIFAYWSLPQIFFLGLYAVLGEVLVARRLFWPYMWAPVLNNVVVMASIGLYSVVWGADPDRGVGAYDPAMIAVIGGGATIGIAAQAMVLWLAWRRCGLRYRPDFQWRGVSLSLAGKAASWTFAMLVLTLLAGLVETNVASLASGEAAGNAVMSQAWLIFMLPHSIITVSLVTVFYPRMSESAAALDLAALRAQVGQTLRLVLLPVIAATVLLIAVSIPFSRFFQSTPQGAVNMAFVLVCYLAGLIPFTVLFVLQRCFYALADTRTPFFYTLAQTVLVVAGTLACARLPVLYIAPGIALVVSVAGTIQLGIAAVLLRRRLRTDAQHTPRAARGALALLVLQYAVAAAAAFGIAWTIVGRLGTLDANGFALSGAFQGLIVTVLAGSAGAVTYLAMLWLFRVEELRTATALITTRFRGARAASR